MPKMCARYCYIFSVKSSPLWSKKKKNLAAFLYFLSATGWSFSKTSLFILPLLYSVTFNISSCAWTGLAVGTRKLFTISSLQSHLRSFPPNSPILLLWTSCCSSNIMCYHFLSMHLHLPGSSLIHQGSLCQIPSFKKAFSGCPAMYRTPQHLPASLFA